ncbi:hypothetical protein [Robertkochia solimangrovi]|uniref:hypothetical protein n=1 Tax=Robertkochia solimangrovi TaxID=2213046 RepID=UPI001180F730|nr:hypothetical protein [Robertkochia solimangrovi]TRZ41675.1 hypothetical protein DMZ48_16850 [Robertkochia solimangrovi]
MRKIECLNHTTRVEAVIENLRTVLKKNRGSLLEEEVNLLENCIDELKELNRLYEVQACKLKADDILLIGNVLMKLLRFFDIDIDLF